MGDMIDACRKPHAATKCDALRAGSDRIHNHIGYVRTKWPIDTAACLETTRVLDEVSELGATSN